MKTTPNATVPVNKLQAKFEMLNLNMHLLKQIRQNKNLMQLVVSCKPALEDIFAGSNNKVRSETD